MAVTAEFPEMGPDWPLLRAALADRGITAATQVWNDPAADWAGADLVVAYGAWDYIHHVSAFLRWVDRVAGQTTLVNPAKTLRWNLDKHYLAVLARAGVPTVPTNWVEPGDDADTVDFPPGEFVLKPAISCGGFQTARYADRPSDHAEARVHLNQLRRAGNGVMVQAYQAAVDTQAETGLVFLGGAYSHAIRKAPLLAPGTRPRANLHDEAAITPTQPTPAQRQVAEHALGAAQALLGPLSYARADLVPGSDGKPQLLELELLEPALYLTHHPPAAARFADVLSALLAGV